MHMEITIRQETLSDHPAVFALIQQAFQKEVHSDHREQFLVERLRKADAFIPELSLVAELGKEIVGYVILSKVFIRNAQQESESLALAPVAVLPAYHGKGIGGKLIRAAHVKAHSLGFLSIIILGHPDYYPRFGYKQADQYGIELPFGAPPEYCFAIELESNSLQGVSGMVIYPKPFLE